MVRPCRRNTGNPHGRNDETDWPRECRKRPWNSPGKEVEEIKGKILPPKERRPTPPSPTKKRGEYHFQNPGKNTLATLKDGLPHGYGRIQSPDGERFFGEFENGKPYGYGTHFSSQGFIIFSGLWEGDKAIAGESPQARLRAMLKSP